jgi:hypothetical protein
MATRRKMKTTTDFFVNRSIKHPSKRARRRTPAASNFNGARQKMNEQVNLQWRDSNLVIESR